jgi:hypothetical protein
MVARIGLVDAVTGAPEWTGRQTRGFFSSLFGGKTAARPLGCRSGVAYGTPVTTITVSGTTWTIKPHAGALDVQTAAAASVYPYYNDADVTGSHDAAHAVNARKDLLSVRCDDPAEADGSTDPAVTFVCTKGAEDGSNVAPATPARSMALAWINVPASGGGASTITWVANYLPGGITPVRTVAEWTALMAVYPPSVQAIAATLRADATVGKWLELSANGTDKYVVDARLSTDPDPAAILAVYNYRPADAAALAALTGMRLGDRAFQVDTGVTYRYNGAAWKAWESDWITYATTLSAASGTFAVGTGGSASNVTQYRYEQGTVRVRFSFVLGTSGQSMGTTPKFTLPVASATPAHAYLIYGVVGDMLDSNVTATLFAMAAADNLSTTVVRIGYMNNVAGLFDYPTATAPWTWAAGDALQGTFTYTPA